MHETLNEVFSLNIHALERLEPGSLVNKGVDMLMLPATFSPALDDSELTELKSFVEGGGTAVLSVALWAALSKSVLHLAAGRPRPHRDDGDDDGEDGMRNDGGSIRPGRGGGGR